jgi:hypothetical protein
MAVGEDLERGLFPNSVAISARGRKDGNHDNTEVVSLVNQASSHERDDESSRGSGSQDFVMHPC